MTEWSEWFENTATGERGRICREPRDDGAVVCELVVAPGACGPPPHLHPGQDERFAIKEGVLAGKIGRKPFEARAGEEVFAPRMVPHAWWNGSETEPLRMIGTATPGLRLEEAMRKGWTMMSAMDQSRKPSLLMFSVVCNEYRDEIALPIPLWIQRPLFWLLAGLGRRKYGWVLKDVSEWPAEYGGPG